MSDYAEILNILKTSNGDSSNSGGVLKLATVKYVEENANKVTDIKIEVDDLQIDKENIYISDFLLKEHKREVRTSNMNDIPIKDCVIANTALENDGGQGASSHSHTIENFETKHTNLYTRDTLKAGDIVSVFQTLDKQMYIILTRVMRIE